jgi:hypothetical protein
VGGVVAARASGSTTIHRGAATGVLSAGLCVRPSLRIALSLVPPDGADACVVQDQEPAAHRAALARRHCPRVRVRSRTRRPAPIGTGAMGAPPSTRAACTQLSASSRRASYPERATRAHTECAARTGPARTEARANPPIGRRGS